MDIQENTDPRSFLEKYGVNVGGAIYATACAVEGSTFESNNVASSVLMGSSIVLDIFWGHKNKAVMISAGLGLAGTVAGVVEEVYNFQITQLIGTALATVGLGLIAASEPLTNRFEN